MSSQNWHMCSESLLSDSRMPVVWYRGVSLLSRSITAVLLFAIRGYQRLVSPLLGPLCRFHPTCSTYAAQAIERHGPVSGTCQAIARLARCHPLCEGGYDPVR
jgi:putative membrane protein insertion efficiency factor